MARAIAVAIGAVLAFAPVARAQAPATDAEVEAAPVSREAIAPCMAAALALGREVEHACPLALRLDFARAGGRAARHAHRVGESIAHVIPEADRYGSPAPFPERIHLDHSGDRAAGWVFIVASAIVGITMAVGAYYMEPFATPGTEAYDFRGPNVRSPSIDSSLVDLAALAIVAIGCLCGYLLTKTRDGSTDRPIQPDYRLTPAIGPSF